MGAVRKNSTLPCSEEGGACGLTVPCPMGFICRSAAAPAPCPGGYYCAGGNDGASVLRNPVTNVVIQIGPTGVCDAGYFCPPQSATSTGVVAANLTLGAPALSTPHFCLPGTTNGYTGAASAANCTPCTLGTFSALFGANLPLCSGQCLPGQQGVATGQTNIDTACLTCKPGTFASIPGQAFCSPCALGSYADGPGFSQCKQCDAGRYGAVTGSNSSSDCQQCPFGTFGQNSGQALSGCAACPRGTYGKMQGATSAAQGCAACPLGKYTAGAGSPSVSACAVMAYPCPAGMQPRAPPFAVQLSDCVPLRCAAPLWVDNGTAVGAALGCAGCAAGAAAGRPSVCTSCAVAAALRGLPPPGNGSFCPGFTATALLNASSLPPSCVSAMRDPEVGVAAAGKSSATISAFGGAFSDALAYLAAIVFSICLLFVSAAVAFPGLRARLEACDRFGLVGKLEQNQSPKLVKSAQGGAYSMLALCVLFCLACYYIFLAVSVTNATSTSTFQIFNPNVLTALLASTPAEGPAWLGAPAAADGSPGFTGLQVRLLAMGDAGACGGPVSWAPRGALAAGQWTTAAQPLPLPGRLSAAGCPASTANFALTTFSCASCAYSGSTGVSFVMNYSCQSLVIEVVAAGVADQGSLDFTKRGATVYRAQAELASTQASNGSLLAGVSFTVNTILAVLSDKRRASGLGGAMLGVDDLSGWGYMVTSSSSTPSFASASEAQAGVVEDFLPLAAGVAVTVDLPIFMLYSKTDVSVATSAMALVSQLTSLLGLLGVFGFVFGLFKKKTLEGGGRPGEERAKLKGASAVARLTAQPPLPALQAPPVPRYYTDNPMNSNPHPGEVFHERNKWLQPEEGGVEEVAPHGYALHFAGLLPREEQPQPEAEEAARIFAPAPPVRRE